MKNISVPTFTTERLILKAVTEADIPAYTKYFVDYEVISNLAASIPWPYPENGVEEYIMTEVIHKQSDVEWMWGVFLKDNPDELIGAVEFWLNAHPANRGFWLGRPFWGKGIMTEAVEPITDFAFNELGMVTLTFSNALGNERSRRVKEKSGANMLRIEPKKFNNPDFTKAEIWELTAENWQRYKERKLT